MNKAVKKIEKDHELKLTIKQALFFEEWLTNGGKGTDAAMKHYDCKDRLSARNIANENLAKLGNPIAFYMEHKGIGIDKITRVVSEAMDATKWNDYTGEREADHFVRLKAVERVAKLSGMEQTNNVTNNTQVNFNQFIQKEKDEYKI